MAMSLTQRTESAELYIRNEIQDRGPIAVATDLRNAASGEYRPPDEGVLRAVEILRRIPAWMCYDDPAVPPMNTTGRAVRSAIRRLVEPWVETS